MTRSAHFFCLAMLAAFQVASQYAEILVSDDQVSTSVGGEAVILGMHDGVYYGLDPVGAVRAWIRERGREAGWLFQVGDAEIYKIVLERAAAAGLDARRYGAHSLRAGMITALDAAGVSTAAIMSRSGHRSIATMARYVRPADSFALDPLAGRRAG